MPLHASNSDDANFSLICLHQLFIQPHLHLSARKMCFKGEININSFPNSQDGLSLSSHVPIKPNCLYRLLQSQVHFCQGDFVLLTYLLIFTHGKRCKLFTSSGLCSKDLPEKGIPTALYINTTNGLQYSLRDSLSWKEMQSYCWYFMCVVIVYTFPDSLALTDAPV